MEYSNIEIGIELNWIQLITDTDSTDSTGRRRSVAERSGAVVVPCDLRLLCLTCRCFIGIFMVIGHYFQFDIERTTGLFRIFWFLRILRICSMEFSQFTRTVSQTITIRIWCYVLCVKITVYIIQFNHSIISDTSSCLGSALGDGDRQAAVQTLNWQSFDWNPRQPFSQPVLIHSSSRVISCSLPMQASQNW